MKRIKIIAIICAFIFVRSGQSLTIEELSPLLETLKAGIKTEILSEITSITTEIGTNVLTIGEIVGVVQNQEEVIKQLTKELNETKLLLKKNSDHTNAQTIELNYLKKEIKGAIKNLNETQVDIAELETNILGLEEYHNEIKVAIGNQSNVSEGQTVELNNLKQGFKGVVKNLNETQVDVAELEITNYEFQIELKGIQDNQDKIEFVPIIILKLYMGYFCIMKNVKKFRTKIKQL